MYEFKIENTNCGDEMKIVLYPNKVLRERAPEITVFDANLEKLAKDMLTTMYNAPGIGLAAPQVNILQRIFVLDTDFKRSESEENNEADGEIIDHMAQVFINPVILEKEGSIVYEEGCLSLPGVFDKVERAEKILVEFQDVKGETHQLETDGLRAICIQHELDHLDGKMFIDYLSPLKRNFHMKKYNKRNK